MRLFHEALIPVIVTLALLVIGNMSTATNAPTAAAPAVTLEFNAKSDGQTLTAGYRATNRSAQPVYLLNVIWTFTDSGVAKDPNPVYVSIRPDRSLHLGKVLPPLPKTRTVEMRIVPYATKLEPGASAGEVMKLSLPIEEYNPYFLDEPQWQEIRAEGIYFSLQYVRAAENLTEKPAAVDGALHVWHPQLLNMLETVKSAPVRLAVPARRREGEFERF